MDTGQPAAIRELAFYYLNPMWSYGNWIKNLALFFDGIALLVPDYMKDRPEELDRPIVVGLREKGLLEIIEPESFREASSLVGRAVASPIWNVQQLRRLLLCHFSTTIVPNGRLNVGMVRQLLHRRDISSGVQQVTYKSPPQIVWREGYNSSLRAPLP